MTIENASSSNAQLSEVWKHAVLPPTATIQQAIRNLDELGIQIVLVINGKGEFEGTISDGDIRRGLLKGLDLSASIQSIVYRNPLVVPEGLDRELIIQLMLANKIRQIPIVSDAHRIVGLHLWDQMMAPAARPNTMVIMAGGMGTRMRPYTESCPKPMLEVAGKPILEHIIERAKAEGFSRFVLAVHYLGHMIEEHFGDGNGFGVEIEYLRENSPLGTAGALALLTPQPALPFVVANGDVITDIRYGELLDFHERHLSTATMAVRLYESQHPYGVVNMQGIDIVGFEEKPISRSHINAGVYVLSPSALGFLSEIERCDMPTLFERIKYVGQRTVAYPMHEPWLDVGRPVDLEMANSAQPKQPQKLQQSMSI